MVEGTPPGDALPPPPQQATPARKGARLGPVLGPNARTDRTRDTRVAEPWLAGLEDGRPGEGQRLTPDAPHNSGRLPPPGAAPHHPRGTQPPQGVQAKGTVLGPTPTHPRPRYVDGGPQQPAQRAGSRGTPFRHPHSEQRRPARAHAVGPVLGPHARTDRTRDTRVAEPWLPAPEDGRPGEGQRLTPDAPHNAGGQTPPGTPPTTPTARSTDRACRPRGQCWAPHPHARARSTWVADPNSPPSGRAVGGGGAPDLRRPSQRWKAAPPACKGERCGTGARSPRPHRPHPKHTGRGTLAARPSGRAVGGGTAPDTRRPSPHWQVTPPGGRPPTTQPPRHAAPTGHAGQGDGVGSPHPHTRAHSKWVADPNSPPSARAVGGGGAPDLRRPSQQQPQAR